MRPSHGQRHRAVRNNGWGWARFPTHRIAVAEAIEARITARTSDFLDPTVPSCHRIPYSESEHDPIFERIIGANGATCQHSLAERKKKNDGSFSSEEDRGTPALHIIAAHYIIRCVSRARR